MSTNVTKENLQEFATKLHAKNKTIFATKAQVGSPLVASTAAGMTDTDKIYVYTGSETGYTAGNWYYYNGSSWASGGVYNSEAVETDTTLSVSGMAADAKAVGDEFAKDLWGVPLAVREAIYTLLNSAAYATTGLTDEIAVVENWAEEVYSLTLSADTLSLTGSTPQALIATVVPATSSITWSSSDDDIATVVSGVVTGVSNGTCVITATAGALSATCNVTVSGFATLSSISAVYTQSGTVYDTDSLDDLKADLVVTATYSDTSTATVPSANYTLSGTLTVGTSTITVAYSGKTTTFNVTVTKGALYPLYNGTHTFNNSIVTITNHKHIKLETTAQISNNSAGMINLSNILVNTSTLTTNADSAVNNRSTLFTIPSGKTVVLSAKNVVVDSDTFFVQSGTQGEVAINLRKANASTSALTAISIKQSSGDQSATTAINTATDIGCAFMYINRMNANKTVEFDLELTVDDELWI